ncbi:MAG: MFS transporter [Caldimicrobium sp.]
MSLYLGFTPWQSSLMVSGFLLGAILGSLIFGCLVDRYGRKKIFQITLLLYSLGTSLTGFANSFESAFFFSGTCGCRDRRRIFCYTLSNKRVYTIKAQG